MEDRYDRRLEATKKPLLDWVRRTLTAFLFFFLGDDVGTFQTGLYMLTRLLNVVLLVLAFSFSNTAIWAL